jgi:hypothetical protein
MSARKSGKRRKYRGLPVVAHGGALFGYRTEPLRFPQQKFSVFYLCNKPLIDYSMPLNLNAPVGVKIWTAFRPTLPKWRAGDAKAAWKRITWTDFTHQTIIDTWAMNSL